MSATAQMDLFAPAPAAEPEKEWWQIMGLPRPWWLDPIPQRPMLEFEGPQCHWPRSCDVEAKKYLRQRHLTEVLRSDRTPAELLIEAHAAAACDFIPDSCLLYQEAARRRHNEMPERANG